MPSPALSAPAVVAARTELRKFLAAEMAQPVNRDVELLTEHLARKPGVVAVLFYGSGLWSAAGRDTVYDFYLLVEHMADFVGGRGWKALAGALLPPNVYYFELPTPRGVLRSKFAVLRGDQFAAAARGGAFTPHIWARFSQPCRLVAVRDEGVRAAVVAALADAVVTFHERTLPLCGPVAVPEFWAAGLASTYASELRSESGERGRAITGAAPEAFAARTRLALPLCGAGARLAAAGRVTSELPPAVRAAHVRRLARRRPWMKLVVLARLIKAAFTFEGAMDYARYKIERHWGFRIHVTDFQRRHPLIAGWPLLWKVFRRGGLK